jgi:hypothetical protein
MYDFSKTKHQLHYLFVKENFLFFIRIITIPTTNQTEHWAIGAEADPTPRI